MSKKDKGKKGFLGGVKKFFQNAKDKIGSFIDHPQNIPLSAGLMPLKPYQPLMKKKLKKMGKPPGNNLAETTHNFVKYVMKKEVFEEWQYENFQNACFTPNVEDLEFAEEGGEENVAGAVITGLIALIPSILDFIMKLKKKEPDLEDPKNPAPDINSDELDPADISILLPLAEDMKQYLAKAGQTYSNDPVENACKIYRITYPKKQNWEHLSKEIKEFWKNNRKEILSTVAALFVAVGTDPAPDPISQRIGKAVSSTQTAIEREVKTQAKLKTYTPLLIVAAVLAIILITKKK